MSWLLFLSGIPGRLTVIGTLLVALVGWRVYDINHQRAIGEKRTLAKIERASNANAAKAEKARRSVDALPIDGLRDRYSRD